MKRFDFPLERVRRWRSELLSLEELKLQQLHAQRNALAAKRQEVRAELAEVERELLVRRLLEPIELERLDSYRIYIRGRILELEQSERQYETRIAAQREKLLEATRQFEVLDRLKQKALQEWRTAANKEQEDLASELFLAKSRRNR